MLKADQMTASGRVYSRECLEKAVQEIQSKGPILVTIDDKYPALSEVIGRVDDIKLDDDGRISAEFTAISEDVEKMLAHGEFIPSGNGIVDDDGKVRDSIN
jgi:hypothetical protein